MLFPLGHLALELWKVFEVQNMIVVAQLVQFGAKIAIQEPEAEDSGEEPQT